MKMTIEYMSVSKVINRKETFMSAIILNVISNKGIELIM